MALRSQLPAPVELRMIYAFEASAIVGFRSKK